MSVLRNYVVIKEGVTKCMHFIDHAYVEREITDPVTKWKKKVRVLEFKVDWEDGVPVDKVFSVVQEKLAAQLEPYIKDRAYRDKIFCITKLGSGFTAEFQVRITKFP